MKYFFRIGTLTFLLFHISNSVQAQSHLPDATAKVLLAPPDAASITQYGKIPVNLFTGLPNITVPLYEIKVDDYNLPIYLSYSARGVQPNMHEGWVGTNWSLLAGGMITRKINGAPDELVAAESMHSTYGPVSVNINVGSHLGWYWNHGALSGSDWSSEDFLLGYDVPSGGLGIGTNGMLSLNPNEKSLVNDVAADEFDFNVNGFSGSFFWGTDGFWHVRAKDGSYVAIKEYVGNYNFITSNSLPDFDSTKVACTFTKFVLTTADGTQYVFGGDPYSIEFNRSGVYYSEDVNTVATSWRITQIVLPTGKTIDFNYYREGVQYQYNPVASSNTNGVVYVTDQQGGFGRLLNVSNGYTYQTVSAHTDVTVNITDPVYLTNITFPEGQIALTSSIYSTHDELAYPYTTQGMASSGEGWANDAQITGGYSYQINYTQDPGYNRPKSSWHKLDNLEIDDYNGNKLKQINLNYTFDGNNRMFLHSVQSVGYYESSTGVSIPPYVFTYNTNQLPAYCSLSIDHWGFYNGKQFPDVNSPTFQTDYTSYRSPDATGTYIQAGVLTQIDYPTGGYTHFTYQNNRYKKYAGGVPINQSSMPITAVSETYGGGLRIAEIVSKSSTSASANVYDYSYTDGAGTSTGVLGMPPPLYFRSGNFTFYNPPGYSNVASINATYNGFSSAAIVPSQNDDGNIVTYTSVTESQPNNGKTVTTFTNHDNGYGNNAPDGYFWMSTNSTDALLYNYNDRSFERGSVLSESVFDASGNPVSKTEYVYNNDPDRFNSYVPSILPSCRNLSAGNLNIINISAVRNYTFYPYLQQKVETVYPSDHSSNTLITTTDYAYNNYRNLIKKVTTTSDNQKSIVNYRFPTDFTNLTGSDPFVLGVQNLITLSALSIPVESFEQKSNQDGSSNLRTLHATLNQFNGKFPYPDLVYESRNNSPMSSFVPTTITPLGAVNKDSHYESKVYFDNYDAFGNILQQHNVNDILTACEWGYNNLYPIAKVVNAQNTQVITYYQNPTTNYNSITIPSSASNSAADYYTTTFMVNRAGTTQITVGFSGPPGSHNPLAKVDAEILGPGIDEIFPICNSAGNATCGIYTSSKTYTNLAAGQYTLKAWFFDHSDLNSNVLVNVTSPGYSTQTTITGTKEFFFQGFEEFNETATGNNASNVITGTAKTGIKYWNGTQNYIVPFTKPNSRNYTIQWFNLANGIWTLNKQSYSNNMSLSGTIDDVRVFPSDALMTTYTYQPLIGMTSSTDPNGRSTVYEYDELGRLKVVRDQDGNIVKQYEYGYQSPNPQDLNACSTSNCNGVDEECVYGFCQKAKRIVTSTSYVSTGTHAGQWKCNYYYSWTNGDTKPAYDNVNNIQPVLTEYDPYPCDISQ